MIKERIILYLVCQVLLPYLREKARITQNPIDDELIAAIEERLCRPPNA